MKKHHKTKKTATEEGKELGKKVVKQMVKAVTKALKSGELPRVY